jgi:hypothetical protein
LVLRVTKAEHRVEDEAKERQSETEAHTLAERLRQVDSEHQEDEYVDEWDEGQNDPPRRGGSVD